MSTITSPIMLNDMGERVAQAIEALAPSNVVINISTSLLSTGWTNSAPYTQTWLNNKVSDECGIQVEFLAGSVQSDILYLEYEKVPGGVMFTAPKKPSADIPVIVYIINAKAESITSVTGDMVSTSVISGASNVNQALTALNTRDNSLSDQIGTLNSTAIKYTIYEEFPNVVPQKTYTLATTHVFLVTVTGNSAWGDTTTVAIVSPGTYGQCLSLLVEGRHTLTLSGTTLTITKSNYGGGYVSIIMLA